MTLAKRLILNAIAMHVDPFDTAYEPIADAILAAFLSEGLSVVRCPPPDDGYTSEIPARRDYGQGWNACRVKIAASSIEAEHDPVSL